MSSRLLIHRAVAAVVTIVTVAFPAERCVAADPPSITGLASRSTLSADDRTSIEEYATAYTAKLLESPEDAGETRRVRSKLVDVIRRGGTSDVFRDTYSRAALPGLEKVIKQGSPDQAVTALIVVAQLGTEQALNTLVESCQPSEPRRHVRLSAARSCGQILAEFGASMAARKVTGAARELAVAAERESDPHTLRHEAQAIHAATEATDDEGARDQMHTYLVRVIESTAERAAKAKDADAAELLAAIYPVLHRLRAKYIVMQPDMQKKLGKALGPCVRKVLDVATTHWSEFQVAMARGKAKQPANIIAVCERFLATIDRVVRGGGGERPQEERLKMAWDSGDIQGYKAIMERWNAVLSRPPY